MLDLTSPYLSPYTNSWSVHGLNLGQDIESMDAIGRPAEEEVSMVMLSIREAVMGRR